MSISHIALIVNMVQNKTLLEKLFLIIIHDYIVSSNSSYLICRLLNCSSSAPLLWHCIN